MRKQIPRLLIKGGVLSPAELKSIAETAEQAGLSSISFGSRQDILFPDLIEDEPGGKLQFDHFQMVCPDSGLYFENIVSSYVSTDILSTAPWITGSRYLNIMESIRHLPSLKINITEPEQRLVPLFMGHLNFIASDREDYWYLYIRLPEWKNMEMYPALIFSWDIGKICVAIENLLKEEPENVETLFMLTNDAVETNNRTIDQPLEVPFYPFPYYEGMNRMSSGEYWLGLYWRNNRYDLTFLKALCDLCTEWKIGKICITPWKSFIVKGIPAQSELQWEKLLGRFGINVRHSLLELNWHLPVADDDLLELKQYIVANFDQNDISTYGLTFSIVKHAKRYYYFTSIVVEKNKMPREMSGFEMRDTYTLWYAKNFDPNTRQYTIYAQDVDRAVLPGLLMELSRMYFEHLGTTEDTEKREAGDNQETMKEAFQCSFCFTIYDDAFGDGIQGIEPGIEFAKLPDSYQCPVCEASKSSFNHKMVSAAGRIFNS